MSRFDYVKYDEKAATHQAFLKQKMTELETSINNLINCPRSKALALTKLEEAYMWVGKGIRNDQLDRTKMIELQEDRINS